MNFKTIFNQNFENLLYQSKNIPSLSFTLQNYFFLAEKSIMSSSTQQNIQNFDQQTKKTNFCFRLVYFLLILAFLVVLLIPVIYMLDSKRVHQFNINLLYDVFDKSPQHVLLYKQIIKSKYAVIYGNDEGGLFNFMDYLANKQTLKDRNVIVQDFHKTTSWVMGWIEQVKYLIEQFVDLESKFKNIWILTSETGQNIPKTAILKIMYRYPKDKIYIFITREQKLTQFDLFQYPSITEEKVKLSIKKNFNIDSNTVDLLYKFYGTPRDALYGLDIGNYTHQKLLGSNFREIQELTEEDSKILTQLCKSGQATTKNITQTLSHFRLITHKGLIYWRDKYSKLNYELHKKIKCSSDGIVTEEVLFQIEHQLYSMLMKPKTHEQLIEEEVWNEDEVAEVLQKPKKTNKKNKKAKKVE